MGRVRPEWLILPLALLPVAAAAAFCLWARTSYRAETAPFREDGEARAREWLDGLEDGGAGLRQAFVSDHAGERGAPPVGYADVPFVLGGAPGSVRVRGRDLGGAPWVVATSFPGGLSAEALADAGVRLDVQSGRATVELEGADDGTRAFGDLLRSPNLDRLRTAPLRATTKAFLVRRWLQASDASPTLRAVEGLLSALAAVERLNADERLAERTGAARRDGVAVLSFGGLRPLRVIAENAGPAPTRSYTLRDERTPDVLLVYGAVDLVAAAETPWAGEFEQPLAGRWSVVLPHADRWWRGDFVRRWGAPAAALLVALLLVPLALLVSLRRQRRLDEARARFINELAHDLRTPLTSLRLYAEMLEGERVAPEERGRYTGVIARESARLSALLANLLDLSRLEDGRRTFESEALGVREAVDAALRDFRALYPERADDVSVEGDARVRVRADRTALARCLGNLLDNAGKFTDARTPVRVSWSDAGPEVLVCIADEGPGIPAAERGRVFERYARGARSSRDGIPGTGLGLSLVRELAEGMGGSASLVQGGGGARFELRLPRPVDAPGGERA